MKHLYSALIFMAFVIKFDNSKAQTLDKKIISALDSFAFYQPQEKSYLHTDKEMYIAGEQINFKAFLTLDNIPSALSKTIYITLTDESGNVSEKQMLQLKNGSASGMMTIKPQLSNGTYRLNCYSLWMQNWPDYIFRKEIQILNTTASPSANNASKNTGYQLSFFPESGHLVAGVENVIAFKALNANGNPVNISGFIKSNDGKTNLAFKSTHDGMGKLLITPLPGQKFIAEATINNASLTINLPTPENAGAILKVDNSNSGKLYIKALRGTENTSLFNKMFLAAEWNNQLVYGAWLNMDEGLDAVAINKKNLPSGILHLTLFLENGTAVAERLAFVANYINFNDSLLLNSSKDPRGKNNLTIAASSFKNLDAVISVYDNAYSRETGRQSILSAMLLTNDLKGKVYNPHNYFKDKSPETLSALDLLMLTHGWTRFDWASILSQNYNRKLSFPFEQNLNISGKVMKADGKTPLPNGRINFIVKGEDSTTIMAQALVNSKSEFVANDINFYKKATVYFQGNNNNNENKVVSVTINPAHIDSLKSETPFFVTDEKSLAVNKSIITVLDKKREDEKAITLKEVKVSGRRLSREDELTNQYATGEFTYSDQTLSLENDHAIDMIQYLKKRVYGLNFTENDNGKYAFFNRYDGIGFFSEESVNQGVQFFLNEIPVDINTIEFIYPEDVSLVKVYKGVSAIPLGASRGAIAIYTKKGINTGNWRAKGFDSFKKTGYTPEKEYFNMDYSAYKGGNPATYVDERKTLYWNPNLIFKNGVANINYYNTQTPGPVRIVVEGIDANGNLYFAEKIVP